MTLFRLLRPHGRIVSALRPNAGQFPVVQNEFRCAPVRQLHWFAALLKAKRLAVFSGELRQIVCVGFQIQTALCVQAEHQAVTVNAVRAKHAAGGDLAETGEHLVQILDEIAHVLCITSLEKRTAFCGHYSYLGAAMKKATQCVAVEKRYVNKFI